MKTIFSLILIGITTFLGLQIIIKSVPKRVETNTLGVSQAQVTEPTLKSQVFGEPSRLLINRLKAETTIEHVGADKDGRMDVPKDPKNVAWWEPGVTPGELGSAVLAGHYDNPDGSPSVFYELDELNNGDTIEIYDENENKLIFEVTDKEYFDDASFPINVVFERNDAKRLNLITCAGSYDRESKNYSQRLVVFTKLVES